MTVSPLPQLQSSHGDLHLAFRLLGGAPRLDRLRQSGSAKAFVHARPEGPQVVFLNTSVGMTGGDLLSLALDLGHGCRVSATTQTAERAYFSLDGAAQVTVTHRLAKGAHLDWLPQETILFDRSALLRDTTVSLSGGASCLLLEAVVLGRRAMGETVDSLLFRDRRRVLRDGTLVLFEPLKLTVAALGAGPGVLQGARALASLALVAPGAEAALGPVRDVLDEPGVGAGASAFDGKLTVRLMAADGWPLRRQIHRLMSVLRLASLKRSRHEPDPREKEKLLFSLAAIVARALHARGARPNHPEAIALISDFVVEGARDGRTVSDLMAAGAHVITSGQCMAGVPEMIHSLQIEATFPVGTKLVTVHHPIRQEADVNSILFPDPSPIAPFHARSRP